MTLPWNDWQFWAVSAVALLALLYLFRELLPPRLSPFRKRRRGKPTTLTIHGKTTKGR